MRRPEIVALGQLVDLLRRERSEQLWHELAQKRVAQAVDAFEMFKEQDEPFEMRRFQFSVYAVERMRDRVRDFSALQIALQGKDVVSNQDNVLVLLLRDSPDQNVNLAGILRKISGDLFADKGVWQITDLETTLDRIVITDGDEIHPALEQLAMQLAWIRIAVRKIQPAEQPFF